MPLPALLPLWLLPLQLLPLLLPLLPLQRAAVTTYSYGHYCTQVFDLLTKLAATVLVPFVLGKVGL